MKKITRFLVKNKKKVGNTFFDLPLIEQEEIIKKATVEANKKQSDLVERYNREFKNMSKGECKI